MEIRGDDTTYTTATPEQGMQAILALVGWPAPLLEPVAAGELFCYRDQASKDAWDRDVGPAGTMLHFIIEPGTLTVVSDGPLTALIRAQYPPG